MIARTSSPVAVVAEQALLRVLIGDPRCEADDLDWSRLLPLAERHRLTLRLADWFARQGEAVPQPLTADVERDRRRQAATLALVRRIDETCAARNVTYVIPDLAQEYPDVGRGVALLVSGPPPDVDSEMFIHASASPGRGAGTTAVAATAAADEPALRLYVGRLGRLGEQPRLAQLVLERRIRVTLGDTACWLPSPEDELLVFTLKFMYGRPSLRLGDAWWLLRAIGAAGLDWAYLISAARTTGLLHGLSCLLDYADQINQSLLARPLFDAGVRAQLATPGRWGIVEWKDGAWHYPSAHVTRRLLLRNLADELLAGSIGTMGRLAFVPVIAAANRRRRVQSARQLSR